MATKTVSPLLALAAIFGTFALAACNTVEGAGEDLEQAGETVQDTANEVGDNPDK